VALSLAERAAGMADIAVVAVGRPQLDLARLDTVRPALAAVRPDLIVSAAAYTDVDRAEDEAELAYAVNAAGAREVAAAASALGVPVVHLSTDYVFDGRREEAYSEDHEPAPQSVYGASKLAGEEAVARANPRHLILRTAWVYSPFGRNFVKTMLRLAAEREEITVVADQWGNPTSALDIADAILHAASMLQADGRLRWGVYHLAGAGCVNWSGFARYVLETSRLHRGPHARVEDIASSDYPARARRPLNSRLNTEKFAAVFGWTAPAWRGSAVDVVTRLAAPAATSITVSA
jgi:dTDP-4-dehydrorhamnose reductase